MSIEEILKKCRQANAQGDYEKILSFIHWEQAPEDADILAEIAVALKAVGRFYEADQYAQRSATLNSDQPLAKSILKTFVSNEKNFTNWKNDLHNPRYFHSYIEYGDILKGNGKHEMAHKMYKRAIGVGTDNIVAYLRTGNSLVKLGRYEEAREVYRLGLEIQEHQDLLFGLAEAQAKLGDLVGAIATLKKSRLIDPKHEPSNVGLASYLIQARDISGALSVLDETLQVDPGNGRAYFFKALAYQRQKDFDHMLESAQKSVDIFLKFYNQEKNNFSIVNLAASYSMVASSLLEKKEIDSAIENYSNAIRINDHDFGHYFNRARAYTKTFYTLYSKSPKDLLDLIIDDFEKAYLYSFQVNSYYSALASKSIEVFQCYRRNDDLFNIARQIGRIKRLLVYEDSEICHFILN